MKKLLAVLGVMLFSASVFALNTEASADENCPGKAEFEQKVATQANNYFITQHILINLADPFANLTDAQALPKARCYAQYRVKGETLVDFVRAHAGEFLKKEQTELLNFAGRVEGLESINGLNQMMARDNNDSFIMQYILINLADPLRKLTDLEAAPVARVYANAKVKGQTLPDFVDANSDMFTMNVEIEFDAFTGRIEKLTK